MAPADDAPPSPASVDGHKGTSRPATGDVQLAAAVTRTDAPDDEDERRLRAARRHDLGRPPVSEHEIGRRRFLVAKVAPLDVDGVRTMQVGTALWLAAFLVLVPFVERLRDSDRGWWLVTCLAGAALGLIGWEYCRRRRKALLADPRRRRTDTSELGPLG